MRPPEQHNPITLGEILKEMERFAVSKDPRVQADVQDFRKLYKQIAIPEGVERKDFAIDEDLVPVFGQFIERVKKRQEEWQANKGHLN